MCDVIDNTKYNVIEITTGVLHDTPGNQPTPDAVEFATGYFHSGPPTGPTPNSLRINDECTNAVWHPTGDFFPPNFPAPNTLADITKFRIRYVNFLQGSSVAIDVRVKARSTDPGGMPLAPGTVLPNFAVEKRAAPDSYSSNNYVPGTASQFPSGGVGARAILAQAEVRIVKATENNNTANSIQTASKNGMGFVLTPTVTTTLPPGVPVLVTVTDVLPPGLFWAPDPTDSLPLPTASSCVGPGNPSSACSVAGQQIPDLEPGAPASQCAGGADRLSGHGGPDCL